MLNLAAPGATNRTARFSPATAATSSLSNWNPIRTRHADALGLTSERQLVVAQRDVLQRL